MKGRSAVGCGGYERYDRMGINIGYLTANRTSAGDEVYTPFYAVEPLTEFLPKDKKIWCPFDEEWSAFYQFLSEKGYEVERSSLKEGKDFFRYEPEYWDILVSNPPFSKKNDVLKRAFSFQKPFALLLPVNSIQGKARYKIFNNEIQMLSFDGRVDYHTRQNMECYTKGNQFALLISAVTFCPPNWSFGSLSNMTDL